MSIENIQIIETVSLDFYNNNIKTINVKQLDTDARGVKVNCTEHGKKFKLDALSHSAFVRYKKPDGYDVFNDCYIQDDGSIIFSLTQQMTVVTGKSMLDILIFCSSGLTVGDIEDVTNFNDLGIATLSTMTLGLNIHPNATNLENVESTYEYDALIEALARHVAIERHMEELDATISKNEQQRQTDETARQSAEVDRETAETNRANAEILREENVQNTIDKCVNKTEDNIEKYTTQMNEIIESCDSATNNANNAAERANTSADNADTATSEAQQATSDAVTKTEEMQALIDAFNECVNGVIDDDNSSKFTTYSSSKIEGVLGDINNLPFHEDGTPYGDNIIDSMLVINQKCSEIPQTYNPNLFINGNLRWDKDEEEFIISSSTEETTVEYIGDKWAIVCEDGDETSITRNSDGILVNYSMTGSVKIVQLLNQETITSLVGSNLTLSYEYSSETGIVYSEQRTFTIQNDMSPQEFAIVECYIELSDGYTLNWAKLEYGNLPTKFIPDWKEMAISSIPAIYFGTDDPDDTIGKDGDLYMKIIEE